MLYLNPTSSIQTKSQSGERLDLYYEIKPWEGILLGTGNVIMYLNYKSSS